MTIFSKLRSVLGNSVARQKCLVPVDMGLSVSWASHNVGAESVSDYGEFCKWGSESLSKMIPEGWRLPTTEEMGELMMSCTWRLSKLNGVRGYFVKASNGNEIFLPAAGRVVGKQTLRSGTTGNYWCSEAYDDDATQAYSVTLRPDSQSISFFDTDVAMSVRLVKC